MSIRSLAASAALGLAILLGGCGGGSGLSGTDLAVSGVAPSAPLNGGDTAVFVMTVSNVGDYPATNVTIRNTVGQLSPAFLTITCTASGGGVCPTVTGSTMTVPSLTNGGSLAFTVSSTVVQGASGSISDSMSVTSDTADIYSTNNTVTVTGTAASNDVSVAVTAPPGPLADGAATFTAVVTNAGPNDAPNVTLTTTLGTNFSLAPAGVTCVPTLGAVAPTVQSDGTLLTTLIPVNGVLTCSIPVTLTLVPNGTTTVEMQTSNVGDSRASNNQSTSSGCSTLCNSLGVTATAPPGPLLNSTANFTMVVQNAGPAAATDVTLTNTLSSNLTLAGAINCTPSGGAAAPTLQSDGTLLTPLIPFNGSLSCSVPVTVTAGTTTGTVADTLSVSAAGNTHTPTSATASVSVTLANNVGVTASSPVTSVVGGGALTFNAVVTNTGPSTAFDVALTNVLSPNLTLSGAITCTASGGAVVPAATTGGGLTSPSIPVGGTLNCGIPVTVTSGANGTVFTTFTATAANDQRTSDNSATASTTAVSSSLGVSETTPAATVAAGSAAVFTAVVSNPGPGSASNVSIAWTNPALAGVTFDAAPTCTATGGATCPAVPSYNMTGLSLAAGRTLVFKFNATTASTFRGQIVSSVTVSSNEDQDPANNSSTASTTAVDPRSGAYTAFAADGNSYSLNVDFDAGTYTMSGNGQSANRSFAASGNNYVVNGVPGVEFRVAPDLIVGGHDFAAGVVPYIAARSFVSSLNAAAGSYDFATRNIPSSGAATTHAGTGLINGNTLSVCQGVGTDQNVYALSSCDPSAKINYTVDPNSLFPFVGTDSATGNTYSFYVASSGAAKILISAGAASDGSQQLRLGIIDSAVGLSTGTVYGSSTTSDWVTITLAVNPISSPSPYAYSFSGSLGSDSVPNLGPIAGATSPKSLVAGSRTSDSASVYVLQASPLTIVVGGFGQLASGLMQVAVP